MDALLGFSAIDRGFTDPDPEGIALEGYACRARHASFYCSAGKGMIAHLGFFELHKKRKIEYTDL